MRRLAILGPRGAQRASGAKTRVAESVENRAKLGQVINDTLFSYSELGFQEVETQKYLTELLEREGFSVKRGFAGHTDQLGGDLEQRPRRPTIAIGSDVDGIPKANQDARSPVAPAAGGRSAGPR